MSKSKQHDRNRRAIQSQVGINRDTGDPILKGKGNPHPNAALNRAHGQYLRKLKYNIDTGIADGYLCLDDFRRLKFDQPTPATVVTITKDTVFTRAVIRGR